MRINQEAIVKGGGHISMTPDSVDDLWLLYNLICVDDLVRCSTFRKLQFGLKSDTERVRLTLQVRVLHLVFDPDHGEIRVTGVNTTESEYVKLGAHHALEVVLHQPVSLEKAAWAPADVAAVRDAAGRGGGGGGGEGAAAGPSAPELIAVMMEEGVAEVCSLSRGLTLVKSRVDVPVPRKRAGAAAGAAGAASGGKREAAQARFFEALLAAVARAADWEAAPPRALLLASPGFVRDAFRAHLTSACGERGELRALGRVRIVCAAAPAGAKWALGAALADPVVAAVLAGSACVGEVALLERFHATLAKTPALAQYGWRHVAAAVEAAAVEHLLVCDRLVREAARAGAGGRGAVAALVAAASQQGASVTTVSSMHVSGEALWGLGGVAALLRYELADIDDTAAGMPPGPVEAGAAASAAAAAAAETQPQAGKRLQQQGAAGGGGGGGSGGGGSGGRGEVAGGDRFGVAFDIESDKSDDSDVELEEAARAAGAVGSPIVSEK
jgi:protein pelota